ncbi:dihydropteroate synthase [Nocardioidaceae bacterium]|nr:dihydropteroate synthase [Nocardioidaceae bacterium]
MIDLRALARLTEAYAEDLDRPVSPFRLAGRDIDTDTEPVLMGIVNLSRDSWYRESVAATRASAVRRGTVLAAQGAHLVDVGAESVVTTAERVGEERQREQLVPVISGLADAGVATSVESYHPSVVEACLDAGASVVNLTGSGEDEAMFELAARFDAALVLCHIGGSHARDLRTEAPDEEVADPFPAMLASFEARLGAARAAGVRSVSIDPGVGFSTPWITTPAERVRWQATTQLQSFRLRRLGVPVCHALPAAPDTFGEEVRHAEGFFTVLAALGGTGIFRTHEVPQVAAVLQCLRDFDPLPA